MRDRLFVVIGAGATVDCATDEGGRAAPRPPLVKELFSPAYAGILERYPLAQMASAEIRRQPEDSFSIERFLRERYRDSPHPLDQRKYVAIPFYLQDLLYDVSVGWTKHPDNYDRLISVLLRLQDVVFITLNYDTLLDSRLAIDAPITSLNSYIDEANRWSLIKLHGSVNWGREVIDGPYDPFAPTLTLKDVSPRITFRAAATMSHIRHGENQTGYYPALSIPLGEEDELICPTEHVGFLKNKLTQTERIHLLIIGYSGVDKEVINIVREHRDRIASVLVVNRDATAASEVRQKLAREWDIPESRLPLPWDGTFSSFAQAGELSAYLKKSGLET